METVCIITSGVVALAALAVLWRKTPKSDPELLRSMTATVINAFNAGLASLVKEGKVKVAIAETELHQVFEVPMETDPNDDRVDGEVSLDDGNPDTSP